MRTLSRGSGTPGEEARREPPLAKAGQGRQHRGDHPVGPGRCRSRGLRCSVLGRLGVLTKRRELCVASVAVKKRVEPDAVRLVGSELAGPGLISCTMEVPAYVPLLRQSSVP